MSKVVLEGVLIAFIGALLALAGNAVSPRGISLTHDFFHVGDRSRPNPQAPAREHLTSDGPVLIPGSNTSPAPAVAARSSNNPTAGGNDLAMTLKQEGLGLVDGQRARELFNDPRRLQNLVVFIDARHEEEYKAGHIPGAFQFDYYYADKFLGTIVPVVQQAQVIVVYCNGGECTDSHYAALELANFVPREKLMVYAGGITEWKGSGWEIETGERNSGTLRKGQ
jgi:rhodanese-related sulfurtransferase